MEDFSTYLAITVLPPLGSLTVETMERDKTTTLHITYASLLCCCFRPFLQTLQPRHDAYISKNPLISVKQKMAAHLGTFVENLI